MALAKKVAGVTGSGARDGCLRANCSRQASRRMAPALSP